MALVNPKVEPCMANLIDGSFFEGIVQTFMELDSNAETTLPYTIQVHIVTPDFVIGMPTRLGHLGRFRPCPSCASVAVPTTLTIPTWQFLDPPTDISEIMQLCNKPPLMRHQSYRFSYHFCNHRMGRKLFMDFFCWPEPNDCRGWIMMRYGVDSVVCNRLVGRPPPRPSNLQGDILLDALACLNCDVADMAQLVCKSWRCSIDANGSVLPLRQFTKVKMESIAPELCRVIFRLSSISFDFQRHVSFDDLSMLLHTALKRSRIGLLKLKGDVDGYADFWLFDALRTCTIVEGLRLNFRSQYRAVTLINLCTEAVSVWKTTAIELYNPLHSQMIFGNAQITQKLSRLEVSVPTVDCRKELDAVLFGNPHLEARLQFVFGLSLVWRSTISVEESFFVHYFESVFDRISDIRHEDNFVRVLYIRSVFELFRDVEDRWPTAADPHDDSGFLRNRNGEAEDDGLKFIAYDAGSESRRYKVFWGRQDFYDSEGYFEWLHYYVITISDESSGRHQQRRPRFADWTIRKANWEQRYAAKDWLPDYLRQRATHFDWAHFDFL